jgi:hypothetical protein
MLCSYAPHQGNYGCPVCEWDLSAFLSESTMYTLDANHVPFLMNIDVDFDPNFEFDLIVSKYV